MILADLCMQLSIPMLLPTTIEIDQVINGRSSTEVTFDAILFSALSSPRLSQASQSDKGGSQNHPASASPMIAAVPLSASAVVKRQISAARSSWLVSDRKFCQTTSGRSKFFDSNDTSLPEVTIRS
jgi:hypothetical protein